MANLQRTIEANRPKHAINKHKQATLGVYEQQKKTPSERRYDALSTLFSKTDTELVAEMATVVLTEERMDSISSRIKIALAENKNPRGVSFIAQKELQDEVTCHVQQVCSSLLATIWNLYDGAGSPDQWPKGYLDLSDVSVLLDEYLTVVSSIVPGLLVRQAISGARVGLSIASKVSPHVGLLDTFAIEKQTTELITLLAPEIKASVQKIVLQLRQNRRRLARRMFTMLDEMTGDDEIGKAEFQMNFIESVDSLVSFAAAHHATASLFPSPEGSAAANVVGSLLKFVVKDVPYDALSALGGMKLNGSNSIEVERMVAACIIQKNFRKYRKICIELDRVLNQAALRVQLKWRGHSAHLLAMARREMIERKASASYIQKLWRGRKGRDYFRRRRDAMRMKNEHNAAVRLQIAWRKHSSGQLGFAKMIVARAKSTLEEEITAPWNEFDNDGFDGEAGSAMLQFLFGNITEEENILSDEDENVKVKSNKLKSRTNFKNRRQRKKTKNKTFTKSTKNENKIVNRKMKLQNRPKSPEWPEEFESLDEFAGTSNTTKSVESSGMYIALRGINNKLGCSHRKSKQMHNSSIRLFGQRSIDSLKVPRLQSSSRGTSKRSPYHSIHRQQRRQSGIGHPTQYLKSDRSDRPWSNESTNSWARGTTHNVPRPHEMMMDALRKNNQEERGKTVNDTQYYTTYTSNNILSSRERTRRRRMSEEDDTTIGNEDFVWDGSEHKDNPLSHNDNNDNPLSHNDNNVESSDVSLYSPSSSRVSSMRINHEEWNRARTEYGRVQTSYESKIQALIQRPITVQGVYYWEDDDDNRTDVSSSGINEGQSLRAISTAGRFSNPDDLQNTFI